VCKGDWGGKTAILPEMRYNCQKIHGLNASNCNAHETANINPEKSTTFDVIPLGHPFKKMVGYIQYFK
jgi:hypothetical protein